MDAKASLTGFLGTLTDEENDYFERSFDALGVSPDERTDPVPADATEAFEDLLTRAALEGEYEETLAVLVPAEWIYLTWATAASGVPEEFYLREWIELHDTSNSRRSSRGCEANSTSTDRSSASADSIASRDSSAEPWLSKSRSSRWPARYPPALNQGRGFSLPSSVTAVASRPPPIPALWSALTSRARRVLAISGTFVCHPIVFVVNESEVGAEHS